MQHQYIGNFWQTSFISVDSLRKGSCRVFVDCLSWKRHLIKTGRAVVNNNNTCVSCKSVGVIMLFSKVLHGKRGVTDTTAWSVIQDGG